ncbi:MAG: hypothetical protein ACKO2V_12985 [Snowella sp.]
MGTKQYLKQFEKFLEQEAEQDDSSVIDYEQEKKEWLAKIDEFYALIQEFIGDYLKQGKIIQEWKIIQLQEDYFGEYDVKQLMLKIGKKMLIFKPIGRFLIGFNRGRIDLLSDIGTVRFVLLPKDLESPQVTDFNHSNAKWYWKIATSPPKVSYLELTEQSFFEALMEVVNA